MLKFYEISFKLIEILFHVLCDAADFMFPSPWCPVVSLPQTPITKFQTRKSSTLTGQFLVVLPPPKIFHVLYTRHGEQCSVNVQCKCPVVLPGLTDTEKLRSVSFRFRLCVVLVAHYLFLLNVDCHGMVIPFCSLWSCVPVVLCSCIAIICIVDSNMYCRTLFG